MTDEFTPVSPSVPPTSDAPPILSETPAPLSPSSAPLPQRTAKKRKKKGLLVVLLVAVVLIVGVGGYFGYQMYQNYQMSKNLDILNREISKINRTEKVDPKIYSTGKVAGLERYLKGEFTTLLATRDAYTAAFDTCQNDLDPQSFAGDDAAFNQHLKNGEALKSAGDAFFASVSSFINTDSWDHELVKLGLSEKDRSTILNEVTGSTKGWSSALSQAQSAQGKLTTALTNYYTFLAQNHQSWSIDNKVLTYGSQDLLDKDNAITQDLTSAANNLVKALNSMQ